MNAYANTNARRAAWGEALLKERAEQLAVRSEDARAPVITRLVCSASGALFALALSRLQRVIEYQRPAPAPSTNPALLGAIGRGGGFYLIYDLARILDAAIEPEAGGHIVLLRRAAPLAGLRVDEALGVTDLTPLDDREISSLTPQHHSISGFARHPDGRLVSLVDLSKMLPPVGRQQGEGGP